MASKRDRLYKQLQRLSLKEKQAVPSVTTIDETATPVRIKVAGTVIPHASLYVTTAIKS